MRSKCEGKGPSYRDKPVNTLLLVYLCVCIWYVCLCVYVCAQHSQVCCGCCNAIISLGHLFNIATENNRKFQLQGQCMDTGMLAILFAFRQRIQVTHFISVCDLYVFWNPGHMVKSKLKNTHLNNVNNGSSTLLYLGQQLTLFILVKLSERVWAV